MANSYSCLSNDRAAALGTAPITFVWTSFSPWPSLVTGPVGHPFFVGLPIAFAVSPFPPLARAAYQKRAAAKAALSRFRSPTTRWMNHEQSARISKITTTISSK